MLLRSLLSFKLPPNVSKMSNIKNTSEGIVGLTSSPSVSHETIPVVKKSKKEKKMERKMFEKAARKARKQENKRNNVGFTDLSINLSEYYFSGGFRRVYPYYFTYETHTKGRWLEKRLIDVLNQEFHCHSHVSFNKAIESGKLQVNGQIVDPTYILKDNDKISHTVHRHELPVLDHPIETVFEDEHTLVINKPCSIPIHPCGRYNLNSLVSILAKAYGRANLRLVHRLDRMTSGLMIFGKDYDTAIRYSTEISNREVKKTYLALVEGEFPSGDAWLPCSAPTGVLCAKFGVQRILPVSEGGKESLTDFRRRRFDAQRNRSLVECRPRTGRTHQIRLHLQFLGHPIANDPIYNCTAWGPQKGKGGEFGRPLAEVVAALGEVHSRELYMLGEEEELKEKEEEEKAEEKEDEKDEEKDDEKEEEGEPLEKRSKLEGPPFPKDPHCRGCRMVFKDPPPENLQLFLHAFKYEGPGWSFQTDLPAWAADLET